MDEGPPSLFPTSGHYRKYHGQVHGSNGYLVEEHPLLLTIAALLILVVLWVILRGR